MRFTVRILGTLIMLQIFLSQYILMMKQVILTCTIHVQYMYIGCTKSICTPNVHVMYELTYTLKDIYDVVCTSMYIHLYSIYM